MMKELLDFVKKNKISVYDLMQTALNQKHRFLTDLFGEPNPHSEYFEVRNYFSDFTNNGMKLAHLEECIKNSQYVFIGSDVDSRGKRYFSTPFNDLKYFREWLYSLGEEYFPTPVCLIVDGKMSKTKFSIERKIEFKFGG